MAAPIEMPFGLMTLVGPKNHVLDGGPDPLTWKGQFTYMQPIVTECYGLSVCLPVIIMSPAKIAEPIEKPFGLRTRVGARNHVLDRGVKIPPWKGAILREGAAHCKVEGHSALSCAKTADAVCVMCWDWPKESCTRWGCRSLHWKGQYWGRQGGHCKIQGRSAVICAKTAEPIELPFRL